MEDLKQIQEFFSKPLNENAFVEAFKLEKALKGMGYDVKVKYLDDFGKDVFEIYFNNPADADDSIFYDAKKLGYDNVRVFANPQESVNEDKKLTYNDFVRMVRDDMMAGSAPDERPSKELVGKRAKAYYNDYLQGASVDDLFEYNTGLYYDPAKERNAVKAKQASKSGLEKVKDFVKKVMKEEEITVDDATEFKINLKHLLDKHAIQKEDLSDYEEKEANYDELYSDYLYKMVKEVAAEKGYSKFLVSKDNPKGETDGLTTATMNKILMNVIKDLDETIKLGKNLNEELCPKGKAYIKKRQAAGEKSSAYLSGRAVKVCKGQMKG